MLETRFMYSSSLVEMSALNGAWSRALRAGLAMEVGWKTRRSVRGSNFLGDEARLIRSIPAIPVHLDIPNTPFLVSFSCFKRSCIG